LRPGSELHSISQPGASAANLRQNVWNLGRLCSGFSSQCSDDDPATVRRIRGKGASEGARARSEAAAGEFPARRNGYISLEHRSGNRAFAERNCGQPSVCDGVLPAGRCLYQAVEVGPGDWTTPKIRVAQSVLQRTVHTLRKGLFEER